MRPRMPPPGTDSKPSHETERIFGSLPFDDDDGDGYLDFD